MSHNPPAITTHDSGVQLGRAGNEPRLTPASPEGSQSAVDEATDTRRTVRQVRDALQDIQKLLRDDDMPTSEQMWEKLHTSMDKYDEGMLNRWNSNMNNLLIFAGLFSAVVTAFIIESYQWLQADPADGTLQVLQQISAQLSGLSFTVSSTFLNSTAPHTPPDVSPFNPVSTLVTVNVLWFMSLILSLIAALFTILVQQWLQEYPLRGGVASGRSGVRIRQYRYEALHRWGVPDLVAILPVLLQIALVLFFVGLLNLLWSLNKVVAGAIIGVLTIPALFLVVSSVMPLIYLSCSYKSPLSIMAYTMCQIMMVGFVDLMRFLILQLGHPLAYLAGLIEKAVSAVAKVGGWSWSWHVDASKKLSEKYILPRTTSFFIKAQHYHLRLSSRRQIAVRDVGAAQKIARLDQNALAWGHHAMPSDELLQLEVCLPDLRVGQRAKCVLAWTEMALSFNDWTPRGGSLAIDRMFTHHQTFAKIDQQVALRLRRLLIDETCSLLKRNKKERYLLSSAAAPILMVLRQLVKCSPRPDDDFMRRYTEALFESLGKIDETAYVEGPRILARCMFECWNHWKPQLNDRELTHLADCVLKLKVVTPSNFGGKEAKLAGDALITFCAAIFLEHARRASAGTGALNVKVIPLIQVLRRFTTADKGRIMFINGVSYAGSDEGRRISVPVWPSLCHSLRVLVEKYSDLQSDQDMKLLVDNLVSIFREKRNARTEGVTDSLRRLKQLFYPNSEENTSMWLFRQHEKDEILRRLSKNAVPTSPKLLAIHTRLLGVHRARDRFLSFVRRAPPGSPDLEADGDLFREASLLPVPPQPTHRTLPSVQRWSDAARQLMIERDNSQQSSAQSEKGA